MPWRRKRAPEDFNLEVQSHLELEVERLMAEGLNPAEAREEAHRTFGNVTLAQERFYESGRLLWLDNLLRDVRFALRALPKNPGFAIAAIVTLAVGIGASTAIFSLVKPLLLQPLPYRDHDHVVRLYANNPARSVQRERFSLDHLVDLQKQSRVFEQIVAVTPISASISGEGEAELVMGWWVTPGFCAMVGVEPMMGRCFLPEEERPKGRDAVLIFHSLWQRRYGGDPGIVGKTITVYGYPYTVVGVMPPGFRFGHRSSEILLPLQADFSRASGDYASRTFFIYARLKRSVNVAQAQAELDVVARRLEQEYPDGNKGWRMEAIPIQEDMIGQFRTALLILLAAGGLLLTITCANVASLSLARTAAREKEMAARCALGAGWRAVVRTVFVENFLLAGAGAIASLPLAAAGVRLLRMALPDRLRRGTSVVMLEFVGIDAWVLGFTVAITLLAALAVGLAPACRAARPDLNEALKNVGTTTAGAFRSRRIHDLLVVGEVAVALVLVIGTGLMVQSLLRLSQVDAGFRPDHVLTVQPLLPSAKYDRARWAAFYADLGQRVERLPGAVSVARTNTVPMAGWDYWTEFHIPGQESRPGKTPRAIYRLVTAAYFQTLGIPLRAGRIFNDADGRASPGVAAIDEETARQYFPGDDPVGKWFQLGKPGGPAYAIIGVVGSIHDNGLDNPPRPTLYFPEQDASRGSARAFMIRAATDPKRLLPLVRAEIRKLDPEAALWRVSTTRELLNDFVWQRRLFTTVLSGLAGLALFLATAGLYGLMQYTVTRRTREIAIRMAMGAERGAVLWLSVARGLRLVAAGIVIGVPASLALTRLIANQLYGIEPTDPATYVAVCLVLILAGVLGSYVPARRAARMDPAAALRYE